MHWELGPQGPPRGGPAGTPTPAGRQGLVPGRLPVGPQHTRDGRGLRDPVAGVTLVGDAGAQLEICPDARPVHYISRVKTGLPRLLCGGNEGALCEGSDRGVWVCLGVWLLLF